MRSYSLVLALSVPALLACSAAEAASLQNLSGKISINQGHGFAPINGAIELNHGDSVMAAPGASAVVAYGDQCRVPVSGGTVMVVAQQAPCQQAKWDPPAGLGGCSLKDGDS